MPAVSLSARAKQAGLELVVDGDKAYAKQGDKIIAWHTSSERALNKALERLEEERLRKLPYDEEIVLKPRASALPVRAAHVPAPVAPARVVAAVAAAIVTADTAITAKDTAPEVADKLTRQIKGSIIKSKYKERYKKNGGSCGDLVAGELAAFVVVLEGGKARTDLKKLRQVAEDNGLWKDSYLGLNPGQQRMTIGNRLRQKYATGDEIVIGGCPFVMEPVD